MLWIPDLLLTLALFDIWNSLFPEGVYVVHVFIIGSEKIFVLVIGVTKQSAAPIGL